MKDEIWGKGWDYLLKDVWDDLDKIRTDNLYGHHDKKLINHCFQFTYSILLKEVNIKITQSDWDKKDKLIVAEKAHKIRSYFQEAKSLNDKVIAINAAEQFLRAIY